MISSLRARLLLAVSVLALSAVVAVALSARQWTRVEFRRFQELQSGLSPDTEPNASGIATEMDGRCCEVSALGRVAERLGDDDLLVVMDAEGVMLAHVGPRVAPFSTLRARGAGDRLSVEGTRTDSGSAENVVLQFRGSVSERITTIDGRRAFVYVVRAPTGTKEQPGEAFLGSVDRRLIWVTSFVGGLAVLITWALTRRLIRPLDELGRAARDVAHGDLARRVETHGSDEVAQLAQSFNAMASELEQQQTLRRDLVRDVAHELRTPLTALQCRLETILDGMAREPRQALAGANEEVQHLSRLVDDLQELALAEARELTLTVEDVRVADVATSAVRAAGLGEDPRVRIAVPHDLTVRADAMRLRQVLLNLLTNADRHTPPAGIITLRGSRAGDEFQIEVHNTGSSLDDEQRRRIFDRFYRTDVARQRATGGSGLGLAIVKHLIEAQGGRVYVTSDASGVTVGCTLPGREGLRAVDLIKPR